MTSSEPRDDRKSRPAVSAVPAFDVTKTFPSMFELGMGMLRTQQQMFAGVVRATKAGGRAANYRTPGLHDVVHGDGDQPARPVAETPDASGIALLAYEISRSPEAGSDVDNWLHAEREIHPQRELIAARAREIAASPAAQGDLDNWLQAEAELRAAGRI